MSSRETALGVASAVAAFTIWGLAPVYYKLVAQVGSGELLAHRIIWSLVLLAGAMVWFRARFKSEIREAFSRTNLKRLALTTLLIGANWLMYILAVQLNRITEISLGYFINPLVSVLMGFIFLKERFGRARIVALGLAATGVLVLVVSYGQVPWISLGLAASFSLYGLVRKVMGVPALPGQMVELSLMTPLALVYLIWLGQGPDLVFTRVSFSLDLLLALAGLVSVAPLTFFLAGVSRLKLSTMGIIQYIAPSMNLVLAVVFYGEPFTRAHIVSFGFIWSALAVYSWASFRERPV